MWADGACSLTRLSGHREVRAARPILHYGGARPQGAASPTTVYFNSAGRCGIHARERSEHGPPQAPEVEQDFTVAKNPSEKIAFITTAPKHATVGGLYRAAVVSSASVEVEFVTALTDSVCRVTVGGVSFLAGGACIIRARQAGSRKGAPEAQQSITVRGPTPPTRYTTIDTDTITVPLVCSRASVRGCSVDVELFAQAQSRTAPRSLVRPKRPGGGWISVGHVSLELRPGEHKDLTIRLNAAGRLLVAKRRHLSVKYIVTGEGVTSLEAHLVSALAPPVAQGGTHGKCDAVFPSRCPIPRAIEPRLRTRRSDRLSRSRAEAAPEL